MFSYEKIRNFLLRQILTLTWHFSLALTLTLYVKMKCRNLHLECGVLTSNIAYCPSDSKLPPKDLPTNQYVQ